jgi:hypothetical protein
MMLEADSTDALKRASPLAIPEINEAQLHTLREMVTGTQAFSQIVPQADKDSPKDYEAWLKGEAETEHLVQLGLVKEITEACSSQLANVFLQTNRKFKIFEITPVGMKMFSGVDRTPN